MARTLIHLYSPSYLLSALAALHTVHPEGRISATFVVQLPGADPSTVAEIARVVRALLNDAHWVNGVIELSDEQLLEAVSRGSISQAIGQLLGHDFEEFYYAHDSVGATCRLFAAAYPTARRICIGDGFGMVYRPEFIASYASSSAGSWQRILRKVMDRLSRMNSGSAPNHASRQLARLGRELAPIKPDLAALVLPVDPSGDGLEGIEWVCCPRESFVSAVKLCHTNALEFRRYMRRLLDSAGHRKRYLLLTEPYGEAGLVQPRRELAMFYQLIREHCRPGSVVFLKPHPLEPPDKFKSLRGLLSPDYEIVPIAPPFARIPVEVWKEVIEACTVVCMAYPVLSLKYLYGIDVVQPMSDKFIDEWIEPDRRAWSRDSLRLYMEPLKRLAQWDGHSLLWSGVNVGDTRS